MNKDLFIHRVRLPQMNRKQESNDHSNHPHMNLFGQSPGAPVMAERIAVDDRQDLIAEAARSASVERQHLIHQQQEKPMDTKEKPMTAEELRAMTQNMPRSLGAAVGVAMPPRADKQAQSEGQGGRHGGQERPSEASYYNPLPIGGISMPKRGSDIGDAVAQQDQAQRRRRSRSI